MGLRWCLSPLGLLRRWCLGRMSPRSQLISIMGLGFQMQLMRSKERSRTVERKACEGFLLTRKYLSAASSVWDLREKPSFQLTKTVVMIKIPAVEPQGLQVDPVVGVTALNSSFDSVQDFLNLNYLCTAFIAAPLPHKGCVMVNTSLIKCCTDTVMSCTDKRWQKNRKANQQSCEESWFDGSCKSDNHSGVKTGLFGSEKRLSALGTWNLAFISFSWLDKTYWSGERQHLLTFGF